MANLEIFLRQNVKVCFLKNVAVKQLKGDFLQFIFELYNEQCFTFRSTF